MARKDPIAHLGRSDTVSERLAAEVAALGAPGRDRLAGLLAGEDDRAAGHALRLLAEAGDPRAMAYALGAIGHRARWEAVRDVLARATAAEAEALLAAEVPFDREPAVLWLLAELAPADPRFVARVEALLALRPYAAADVLARTRDPRWVRPAQAAIDRELLRGDVALFAAGALVRALGALGVTDPVRDAAVRGALRRMSGLS